MDSKKQDKEEEQESSSVDFTSDHHLDSLVDLAFEAGGKII